MAWYSQTWTWFDGAWHEGNPGIVGPRSHVLWQASSVFDGGRYFDGVAPDIDLHAARVNRSATALGLNPTVEADFIVGKMFEGVKKFAPGTAIYVKPMYWGEADGPSTIMADPESTQFALCLFEASMGDPGKGFSVTKGAFRRPSYETAPTDAKAGCLYPNNGRAMLEAKAKGFDNAVLLDVLGNVCELGTANLFIAKDGVVMTPAATGVFLAGITRSRIIQLLRDDGFDVRECVLKTEDLAAADEIFAAGNYGKVTPILRFETREFSVGPVTRRARELYWAYAHA